MNERMTEIEVALAYDRRQIDELNEALIDANREIEALKLRLKRMETTLQALQDHLDGAPPANEKPPHY